MKNFEGKHPLHMKNPELQKSEEVQKSVEKHERLSGEKLPNEPTDRIEAHIDRLEKIFLNSDEDVRKRNIEMLKPAIYDEFIIKPEEVPESYFELQQRIARERGIDAENITPEIREQMINTIIEDQKQSLDNWIDYLTSDDAVYPTWFKHFAFSNIVKLSQFDKSLGKFKKRNPDTTAPYPDVFREPLAQICDVYEQVAEDNNLLKTDPEVQRQFSKSFPKLYAEKITESLSAKMESNEEIRGTWIKYEQGNQEDAQKLYDSLQGKGTGWCTAGQSTAKTQINSGDFYVFYTYNDNNEPTQPRLAIRMDGNDKIGEVRGVNEHQEVEPILSDTLDEKLSEFGTEADKYKKKSADMKQLTAIDNKLKENPDTQLSSDELKFLYETDSEIEGFGYKKDPRIKEILEQRNPTEDLPILFDCTPEQIATNQTEVSEDTKVYNGELYPNIFKELPKTIEKIYTNFPEKISEVYIKEIEIPQEPKTAEQYITDLEKDGHEVTSYAKDILSKANLEAGKGQKIKLIIPSNKSLGFPQGATRAESKQRAIELGIANETLPAIIGPELRKQYTDQPNPSYILIDMDSITDSDGSPDVFNVRSYGAVSYLDAYDGRPGRRWRDSSRWAFSQ
jgi:hypothetical protein